MELLQNGASVNGTPSNIGPGNNVNGTPSNGASVNGTPSNNGPGK